MQFQYRVRKKGFSEEHAKPVVPRKSMTLHLETNTAPPAAPPPPAKKQPRKRHLVVKNAETKPAPTPVGQTQLSMDIHVMEEMKQKMSQQMTQQIHQQMQQQKDKYDSQIEHLKHEEAQKRKELQTFMELQERKRNDELKAFTEMHKRDMDTQKKAWLGEQEQKLQDQKKAWEDSCNRAIAEKEAWAKEYQTNLEHQKQSWVHEHEQAFERQKEAWLREQEDKLQRQKQEWMEAQQPSSPPPAAPPVELEKELAPALERYISQVINCSVPTEEPQTRFEQMIGPTIEKLVHKIINADYTEDVIIKTHNDNDNDDDNREDKDDNHSAGSLHYDDVYDFEIDNDSIQNIRSAYTNTVENPLKTKTSAPIRNLMSQTVNPLLTKKDREYMMETANAPQVVANVSPVELDTIYNKTSEEFFDNAMRSNVSLCKKWYTYGKGIEKDIVTDISVHKDSQALVVCGLFSTINMARVNNIALFDMDKKIWDGMKGGVSNMASCVEIHKGIVYVGGVFSQVGSSLETRHIAAYHIATKTWTPVCNELNSECTTMCVDTENDKLYIGGTFTGCNDVHMPYIGVYDIATETWSGLPGGGLNAACRSLCIDQQRKKLYAGGLFTRAGERDVSYIAEYDLTTHEWDDVSYGLQGYCNTLCLHENLLYAGGTFTCTGNEVNANNIACYDLDTKTWTNLREGVNGVCNTVVVDRTGNVFIGGSFTTENEHDTLLNRVGMYDPETQCWKSLDNYYHDTEHYTAKKKRAETGLSGTCKSLFVYNDTLYVGGSFSRAGDIEAGCIARYKIPDCKTEK